MRVIHCEQCATPLPWTAQYCAVCGTPVSLHPLISDYPDVPGQYTKRPRPGSLKTYSFYKMGPEDPDEAQPIDDLYYEMGSEDPDETQPIDDLQYESGPEDPDETQPIDHTQANSASLPTLPAFEDAAASRVFLEDWSDDEEMDEETLEWHRKTWQKFVAHKPPAIPVGAVGTRFIASASSASASSASASSAPAVPITPALPPYGGGVGLAIAPVQPTPPPPYKKQPPRSPLMPRVAGWIAIAIIIALLLGGGFGVFVSLGRNAFAPTATSTSPSTGPLTLQVTPGSIAFGGTITLLGSHFTPRGRIRLTRDAFIPIIDTSGSSTTTADASGSFSDTVTIGGSWTAGTHIIRAEDFHLHKPAIFTLLIKGHSSQRPSHLVPSVGSVDLGSGDQATDSAQSITLSNTGSDEIDWQSSVTQPWLMRSPTKGAIASWQQMKLTLAADRTGLKVGSYTASIIFTSNIGSIITLPVKMQVTPLQVGHAPVMQVTPAVLSFTGVDGSASPGPQVVTISNPGVLPLQWNAASATNDGFNWLSASPPSGTVAKGAAQSVTISVNSSQLLPGVYYGSITFSSQGSPVAVNNPQTIYVSVTIAPQCAIQVFPGSLSFTAVYLQPAPSAKSISIDVNQGCSGSLFWTASAFTGTAGRWLTISASAGITPSSPRIGINVTGLKPGTYSGSLVFSSAAGTQTMPVTLVMGQPTAPGLSSAPALLNVKGVVGQTTPSIQSVVLSNIGAGTLSWSAVATTTVGGAWLSVAPAKGVLASQQSSTLTVTVTLLATLTPGTYTGSVVITGINSAGQAVTGSPQTLPVTFIVQATCSATTPLPALAFQSTIGQPAPAAQQVTISAPATCVNALTWSATVATVPAGGTWLTATPATGTVSAALPSLTMAGIVNTGLLAGTYSGSITITALDSVTHLQVGLPQVVTVTLTVLPVCTLQPPSVANEVFNSTVGVNPAAQTFTIGVVGACTGGATITPTVTMTSGAGWLAVTPASAPVAANGVATFTVTVTSAALAAGSYAGSISLAAVNSTGVAIGGSPQVVGVTLTVTTVSPPALTVTPASLTFNITPGPSSQAITVQDTGGSSLNWSAALAAGAPVYVTITPPAGGSLAAGISATLTISVNATGLPAGTTASTAVTISAVDPLTGGVVSGSPATVSINITVIAPPAAMQLSTTTLAFTTTAGVNPVAQTITITNTGGGTLNWTAGAPSQTWLTVTPSTGSDPAGGTSTPSFNINVAGLKASTYSATVNFTAPGGLLQTVTVTLTVN